MHRQQEANNRIRKRSVEKQNEDTVKMQTYDQVARRLEEHLV